MKTARFYTDELSFGGLLMTKEKLRIILADILYARSQMTDERVRESLREAWHIIKEQS